MLQGNEAWPNIRHTSLCNHTANAHDKTAAAALAHKQTLQHIQSTLYRHVIIQ